ncbi:MAG: cytochrome c maturation protein CcmE [Acidimicrobiia bacterium]
MKRYARFVIPAVVVIGAIAFLMVNLGSSLVYYNTPGELLAREAGDVRLRLGGRVVPGSVVELETAVAFEVEDCDATVGVIHTGVPPELFQEGIGIVVEGVWTGSAFESDLMLVKHDEEYRSDAEDYDKDENACTAS